MSPVHVGNLQCSKHGHKPRAQNPAHETRNYSTLVVGERFIVAPIAHVLVQITKLHSNAV